MASLFTKVKLYIEANSKTWDDTKVLLQNDGDGDYIKTWTYSFSKPTDSQIASYETAGNTAETLSGVLSKRQTEYLSWNEQLDKLYHDIDDGQLGTGMTESSGIFTFPSTGIYLIQYFVTIGHNADIAYFTGMIRSTANNSSYNTTGEANASTSGVGAVQYQMASMQKIIDCSNTTNVKVKFSYDTSDGVAVQGSSGGNKTYMTFQRLGDT